jgi:HemY protein
MQFLVWIVIVFAVAVGFALLGDYNTGYVVFVTDSYRVELSLNLLLVLTIAGFVLAYAAARLVLRTLALPRKVAEFRRGKRDERVRSALDAGWIAMLEGRFGKARQHADKALSEDARSSLAALLAARAALEVRAFNEVDRYLEIAHEGGKSLSVPRLMIEAEQCLAMHQPLEALKVLQRLREDSGLHTAALRLELRALQAAGRWQEIPPLVEQLAKRDVIEPTQAQQLRWHAQSEHLRQLAADAKGLREYWNRIPDADRRKTRVALAAARSFLQLGGSRQAAEIISASLGEEWSDELVQLYGECTGSENVKLIQQAEAWLPGHSDDAVLLMVLGRLCMAERLWGKAQTYLEASLALEESHTAHILLGEMLGRIGETDKANAHLAAAMRLAMKALQEKQGRQPALPSTAG